MSTVSFGSQANGEEIISGKILAIYKGVIVHLIFVKKNEVYLNRNNLVDLITVSIFAGGIEK